ncbi:MAG TPA: AAA family ATPase [Thermoanaerobaculia bacterium]
MATVVVLNGTSSSGKTSIARTLQELAPRVFLSFSIDNILDSLPASVVAGIKRGEPLGRDRFLALVRAFYACVRELAGLGHDLVIDHAITSREEVEMLVDSVRGHRTLLVGLECAVEVLDARERGRGDRRPGLAAAQAGRVHQWLEYDVVIDTSASGPDQAAREILSALQSGTQQGIARTREKLYGGSRGSSAPS